MPTRDGTTTTAPAAVRSLVPLLGEQRAAIVEELQRAGDRSVSELAGLLGISEVATRRHLGVLGDEGLVAAETVKQGRGRPAARYHLTDEGRRLFPDGYDRFASEVLDFLADEHGRQGMRAFLRWRLEREVEELRGAVTAEDLHERLDQLADALSAAGYQASVSSDGDSFTLTQDHCAIYDVAREHPEVCAYEAATFARVLGRDVTLSRRQTLTDGSSACVCCVAPRGPADASGTRGDTSEPAERADDGNDTATSDTITVPGPPRATIDVHTRGGDVL